MALEIGIKNPELLDSTCCVFGGSVDIVFAGVRGAHDLHGNARSHMARSPCEHTLHVFPFGWSRLEESHIGIDPHLWMRRVPTECEVAKPNPS